MAPREGYDPSIHGPEPCVIPTSPPGNKTLVPETRLERACLTAEAPKASEYSNSSTRAKRLSRRQPHAILSNLVLLATQIIIRWVSPPQARELCLSFDSLRSTPYLRSILPNFGSLPGTRAANSKKVPIESLVKISMQASSPISL